MRQGVAAEPVRVARSVEPLVVLRRAAGDGGERRHPGQHPLGQVRDGCAPVPAGPASTAAVSSQTPLGTPIIPRSCSQAGPAHQDDVVGREAEAPAAPAARTATPRECPRRSGDLRSAKSAKACERPVELVVVQRRAQPGVEGDHLVPRLDACRCPRAPRRAGAAKQSTRPGRTGFRDADGRRRAPPRARRCSGRPRCCRPGGPAGSPWPGRRRRPARARRGRPTARRPAAAGGRPRRRARAGRPARSPTGSAPA